MSNKSRFIIYSAVFGFFTGLGYAQSVINFLVYAAPIFTNYLLIGFPSLNLLLGILIPLSLLIAVGLAVYRIYQHTLLDIEKLEKSKDKMFKLTEELCNLHKDNKYLEELIIDRCESAANPSIFDIFLAGLKGFNSAVIFQIPIYFLINTLIMPISPFSFVLCAVPFALIWVAICCDNLILDNELTENLKVNESINSRVEADLGDPRTRPVQEIDNHIVERKVFTMWSLWCNKVTDINSAIDDCLEKNLHHRLHQSR